VLEQSLAAIESDQWSQEDARAWWKSNMGPALGPSPVVFSTPTTQIAAPLGL